MRIAYVGMDMLAGAFLYLSARADIETPLVVTGEDGKPCAGLKRHARLLGKAVLEEPTADALLEAVREHRCEYLICGAYHRRLPATRLREAGVTPLNLHPTLLPVGRGPQPILHLSLDPARRGASGLTLHVMTDAFDDGPIVDAEPIEIADGEGYDEIETKMFAAGPRLMERFLDDPAGKLAAAKAQGDASYWARPDEPARTLPLGAGVDDALRLGKVIGGYGTRIELHGGQWFSGRVICAAKTAHVFPEGGLVMFNGKIATVALKDGLMRVLVQEG